MAPAVAALAAAGLVTCWRWYRLGRRAGLLLPVAVAVTAGLAFQILDRTPAWFPWLRAVLVVLAAGSVLAAVAGFPGWRTRVGRFLLVPAAVAGLLAILAGPAAFAVATTRGPSDVLAAGDPSAGPGNSAVLNTVRHALGPQGGTAEAAYVRYMSTAYQLRPGQQQMLDYARAHGQGVPITLAVEGGSYGADPFLLNTDAAVVAFGGYLGFDPDPTAAQLSRWVAGDRVRFVLLPQVFLDIGRAERAGPATNRQDVSSPIVQRIAWLIQHCPVVPPARIGPDATREGVLFDCRN
jgi:hypothetical protein